MDPTAVPIVSDETQPLLAAGRVSTHSEHGDNRDPRKPVGDAIIDFDPLGDPDNPLDWPASFKWGIVLLLACMAFTITFTCIGVVPVASGIVHDLDPESTGTTASVLLVTIWELGESAGPLLLAPLSEVFGRYPVINAANVLFIMATVLAALSNSTELFIGARALTGVTVATNVLNPAIVGDMFAPEQRGSAMSLIMVAPLIGGALGPAIAGAVAQSLGWRTVVWISAVLAGACELVFLTCFRETYKVVILKRRVKRLGIETGHAQLKDVVDDQVEKGWRKMWESVMRPVVVFFSSGVLMVMALFGSYVFAYFYVLSVSLPIVLEKRYGLSPAATGAAFMAFSIGSFVGIFICNRFLDKLYIKLQNDHGGVGRPEYRLPLAVIGGFTLPFCIAAYGWTIHFYLPLPLLLLCNSFIGMTLLLAYITPMSYTVDAFGIYSASAMTGLIVTRGLMGTFLPLSTTPLVESFGYGWGFTIMGGICLVLAPIPVLVGRHGASWRQRCVYTRDS